MGLSRASTEMKDFLQKTVKSQLTASSGSCFQPIIAMAAIMACAVLIPITQYNILYGISVGYPASVLAVALVLWWTFHPEPYTLQSLLAANAILYSARLTSYLLFRDFTGWKPRGYKPLHLSRARRVPFAIALSLLYSVMVLPLWYVLKGTHFSTGDKNQHWIRATELLVGLVVSCIGNAMETLADLQKYVVKQGRSLNVFHGPVRGVYRITRHPNYTGEILFWFGLWMGGLPFYDNIGRIASATGLLAIVLIMRGSTVRLEKRHAETYGGQKKYEQWKHSVTAPLFPFTKHY